jgi:hypothetical protein
LVSASVTLPSLQEGERARDTWAGKVAIALKDRRRR